MSMNKNIEAGCVGLVLELFRREAAGSSPGPERGQDARAPSAYQWEAVTEQVWRDALAFCVAHSITAVIFEAIVRLPEDRRPPQEVWNVWQAHAQNTVLNYYRYAGLTGMVCRMFAENGVHAVVLKGVTLSACYPVQESRKMADVDILVASPAEYQKAVDLLRAQGYGRCHAGKHDVAHHETFVYKQGEEGKPLFLELHNALIDGLGMEDADRRLAEVSREIASGLSEMDLFGNKIAVLEPTRDAFYLLLHMTAHFEVCGFGVRQLFDWVFFLQRWQARLDVPQLESWCAAMGLEGLLQAVTAICVERLGLSEACCPWYRENLVSDATNNALFADILASGDFGKSDRTRMMRLSFQSAVQTGRESRLHHYLFAFHNQTCDRFPAGKRCPALLPFLWCAAGFIFLYNNLFKRKTSARQVMDTYYRRMRIFQDLRLLQKKDGDHAGT